MPKKSKAVWEWKIVKRAIWDSFLKLNPRKMMGNPVMFVVEIGIVSDGSIEQVRSSKLRTGDLVHVSAGELIPSDGEIIDGVASVDESAITGESAPVIRESGGDRSAVTGGTRVLSDQIKVKITS